MANIELIIANTPPCMRVRPQWVCWAYIENNGKLTKCPICPTTGSKASSTDPTTWSTFEQAVEKCRQRPDLAGVGYVFVADDPFAGIDLDDCIDAATGQIKPWAQHIVDGFSSYSEVSPSGTGLKIFVRATKPGARCKTQYADGAIEMYDRGRFFTVTGRQLLDAPTEVQDRQHEFDSLYQLIFDSEGV